MAVSSTTSSSPSLEILYTDPNFYLVRPVDQGAASRLRPGDEVILNSSGIYDGKVVR